MVGIADDWEKEIKGESELVSFALWQPCCFFPFVLFCSGSSPSLCGQMRVLVKCLLLCKSDVYQSKILSDPKDEAVHKMDP